MVICVWSKGNMLFSDVIAAKISWTRTPNVLKHGDRQISRWQNM